jgi:hypothetical protein
VHDVAIDFGSPSRGYLNSKSRQPLTESPPALIQ